MLSCTINHQPKENQNDSWYDRPHLEAQIDKMHGSDHAFYLTGSRLFGTATPQSDWDFFAQDSATIREYLEDEGFFIINLRQAEKYMGISTQGCLFIYRKNFVNGSIDVQLQVDVTRKIKAQIVLKEFQQFFKHELNNKTARKELWERAFKVIS